MTAMEIEQKRFDVLRKRCEAEITSAKALCNAAFKAEDNETVWMMKTLITNLERQVREMRLPGETSEQRARRIMP